MSNELVVTKRFIIKTVLCYKTQNRLHFKMLFVYFVEVFQMIDIFYCMPTFVYVTTAVKSTPLKHSLFSWKIQETIDNDKSHFFLVYKNGVYLKQIIGFRVDIIILNFNRYFTYIISASLIL